VYIVPSKLAKLNGEKLIPETHACPTLFFELIQTPNDTTVYLSIEMTANEIASKLPLQPLNELHPAVLENALPAETTPIPAASNAEDDAQPPRSGTKRVAGRISKVLNSVTVVNPTGHNNQCGFDAMSANLLGVIDLRRLDTTGEQLRALNIKVLEAATQMVTAGEMLTIKGVDQLQDAYISGQDIRTELKDLSQKEDRSQWRMVADMQVFMALLTGRNVFIFHSKLSHISSPECLGTLSYDMIQHALAAFWPRQENAYKSAKEVMMSDKSNNCYLLMQENHYYAFLDDKQDYMTNSQFSKLVNMTVTDIVVDLKTKLMMLVGAQAVAGPVPAAIALHDHPGNDVLHDANVPAPPVIIDNDNVHVPPAATNILAGADQTAGTINEQNGAGNTPLAATGQTTGNGIAGSAAQHGSALAPPAAEGQAAHTTGVNQEGPANAVGPPDNPSQSAGNGSIVRGKARSKVTGNKSGTDSHLSGSPQNA
jgi:hypothetical protein